MGRPRGRENSLRLSTGHAAWFRPRRERRRSRIAAQNAAPRAPTHIDAGVSRGVAVRQLHPLPPALPESPPPPAEPPALSPPPPPCPWVDASGGVVVEASGGGPPPASTPGTPLSVAVVPL